MEQKNVTTDDFSKVTKAVITIIAKEGIIRDTQVARLANELLEVRKKIELIERFLSEGYSKFKEDQPKPE